MPRKELYKNKFEFDIHTANIFDDMLKRSVPFYQELQRMIVELARTYIKNRTNVYDLGCSTGTTLLYLLKNIMPKNGKVHFVGIDYSGAMIEKAKEKLSKHNLLQYCELIRADVNNEIEIKNASVVILSLTLQFTKPANRKSILLKAFTGLRKGGCLILVEKLRMEDPKTDKNFLNYYSDFKIRQGYSLTEINTKKKALTNILIPQTYSQNIEMLQETGFKRIEEFFRWYNFSGIVSFKD